MIVNNVLFIPAWNSDSYYDIQNQESIVCLATSKRKVIPLKSASLNFKFNVWKTKKINTFVLLNTDTDPKHMTTIMVLTNHRHHLLSS